MSRVHLVNPSTQSFAVAVITPRWLCVLAAARPAVAGAIRRSSTRARWARWIGHACRRLFLGKPMPALACPGEQLEPAINQR
jgi:hypothetical protein